MRILRITTVPLSLLVLLRGQLNFVASHGFEVLACSADGPELEEFKNREGVPHVIIPLTRTISPIRDVLALIKMVRLIRRYRPQIVHTHTPKAGLIGMLASWMCHTPGRLHTVAGMPLMEKKGLVKAILKITENVTYACATCVYPNSTGLFDFMLREFPAHQAKYKVIGRGSSNGIPVDHFTRSVETKRLGIEFRTEHQIPEDSIVFCFIGRLVADKGVKELLSAYSVVERVVKNTRLILVGPFEEELNPLNDELMQEIRKNPNVICTGFLADVRVPLEITTIFVFPSYREGFPNVLLQACLMEVACIASDINGCNEVVVQQETGLLVPPKDSKKLAAAMLLLAQDRELRDRLAKRGRTFAIANYSQAFVWQELLKEYHSVIAQLHG